MTAGSPMKADGKGLVGNEEASTGAPGKQTSAEQTDLVCVCVHACACVMEPTF